MYVWVKLKQFNCKEKQKHLEILTNSMHKKKGYDVEMWDLGLQEWVHVASTEIPELTLSNILVTFMYPMMS